MDALETCLYKMTPEGMAKLGHYPEKRADHLASLVNKPFASQGLSIGRWVKTDIAGGDLYWACRHVESLRGVVDIQHRHHRLSWDLEHKITIEYIRSLGY
jgi:hypothetical protein